MYCTYTYRPHVCGYEKQGETRRDEESSGATGEERAEAGERASASEVETRGSCLAPGVPLFPQTVAPNATHLSRPTYRAILKPACIPGAGFPLCLLPTRVPARPFFFPSSCGRCSGSLRPTTHGNRLMDRRRISPPPVFREVEISDRRDDCLINKSLKLSNVSITVKNIIIFFM